MKNILFILLMCVGLSSIAQKGNFQIEFSGGKFYTNYKLYNNIFNYNAYYNYSGKTNINLNLSYNLTDKMQLQSENNVGFMYNKYLNINGYVYDFTLMPMYLILRKNNIKIYLTVIGIGGEYIFLKKLSPIIDFNQKRLLFKINNQVKLSYSLNKKIDLIVKYNIGFGRMFNELNNLNIINKNENANFSYVNIGIRYTFGKKEKTVSK